MPILDLHCQRCRHRWAHDDESAWLAPSCPRCGQALSAVGLDATAEFLASRDQAVDTHQPLVVPTQGPSSAADATQVVPVYRFLHAAQQPDEMGRLGPYRVLGLLGRGGMGVVFRAEDPLLKRGIALKVIQPELVGQAVARERFLREARTSAAVENEHVVTIYQVGEDNGVLFLAMPLLQGESLESRLRGNVPLPVPEVVRIGRETATGLAAAHTRGLVHRDVKPANLWLEEGHGRVKVLDFGLARAVDQEDRLTKSGAVLGTPAYMAPEQAAGEPADGRSDLFSLGIVLYRMLTGSNPFERDDVLATLSAVALDDLPPPHEVNPAVPEDLSRLVAELLAKEASQRPATATVVVVRLAAIGQRLAPEPASAVPFAIPVASAMPHTPPRGRSPEDAFLLGGANPSGWHPHRARPLREKFSARTIGLLAALVLLAVGMGVGLLSREKPAPAPSQPERVADRVPAPPEVPKDKSLGPLALVQEPTPLKDVKTWTIETRGHRNGVFQVSYRPDGKQYATAGHDGTIRIWDAADGRLVNVLFGPKWGWWDFAPLAWSLDGQSLAAVGAGQGDIRIWDAVRGVTKQVLHGPATGTKSVTWAPTGDILATGGNDGMIRLWKPQSGENHLTFRAHSGPIILLAWSPDGKSLASGEGSTLCVWNATTGKQLHRLRASEAVWAVAWSPDSKHVAVGTYWNSAICLFDRDTGKLAQTLDAGGYHVRSLAFSPDGQRLACGSWDGTARIYDRKEGRAVHYLGGHAAEILGVAWSPDGKTVLSCAGAKIRTWNAATGELVRTQPGNPVSHPFLLAWSPDGQTLACGTSENSVQLWQANPDRPLRVLRGHGGGIYSLAWSPDSHTLASISTDQTVRQWDDRTNQLLHTLPVQGAAGFRVAWSPDGKWLAGGYENGIVQLWDARTRESPGPLREAQRGSIMSLSWSSDSRKLTATTSNIGEVQTWSIPDRQDLQTVDLGRHVEWACWSPDDKTLAIVDHGNDESDYAMHLYDPTDGRKLFTFPRHGRKIYTVAWSPSGKLLATCGLDRVFRVWDAGSGRLLRIFAGHDDRVMGVAWSPDGHTLASSSHDGTLRLWEPETGRCRAILHSLHNDRGLFLTPDGHYLTSPSTARELVFLARTGDGQRVYAREEFSRLFGWKNDPSRFRLSLPPAPAPVHADNEGERRAADWFLQVGGRVELDIGHGERQEFQAPVNLPRQPFHVVSVRITEARPLKEAELEQNLRELPFLEILDLCRQNLTGQFLRGLKGNNHLWSVDLTESQITDANLVYLRDLPALTKLWLRQTAVRPAGLVHLRGQEKLRELVLDNLPITDQSLQHLQGLAGLEKLHMFRTGITSQGLIHLQGLRKLQRLVVHETKVTTLAPLAGMPLVELHCPGVADLDPAVLRRMPNLQRVNDQPVQNLIDEAETRPIITWQVLGPFPEKAEPPFDVARDGGTLTVDEFQKSYRGASDKMVQWRLAKGDERFGKIDLGALMDRKEHATAFAYVTVEAREAVEIELIAGRDDTLTVWVNGKQMYDDRAGGSSAFNSYRIKAGLNKGTNHLIVRCENFLGEWWFSVRLPKQVSARVLE